LTKQVTDTAFGFLYIAVGVPYSWHRLVSIRDNCGHIHCSGHLRK